MVVGVVFGGLSFRSPLGEFFRGTDVSVATVADLPQSKSIFALGRILPEGEVISVAGPSGSADTRVESLKVSIGDHVTKGDLLATLDNHDRLQAAVVVSAASLEQANKQLIQTRVNAQAGHDEQLALLELQRATLNSAQVDLDRQRKLIQSRATSQQDFDASQLLVDTAEKQVKEAEARLTRYTSDVDENADVQVARANVEVAKASLQQAETQLAQSVVHAPNSGTILDITLHPGERIGQTTLLKMGRTMPPSRLVLVFVLTAVMCILSGVIATKRLNSADPAELF